MKPVATLTYVGAISGIFYAMSKKKTLATTVGYALLFGLVGATAGATIQMIKD
jgi:hypothetical protein